MYKKRYTTVNYWAVCPSRRQLIYVNNLKEARVEVKKGFPDATRILRQTVRGNDVRVKEYFV